MLPSHKPYLSKCQRDRFLEIKMKSASIHRFTLTPMLLWDIVVHNAQAGDIKCIWNTLKTCFKQGAL